MNVKIADLVDGGRVFELEGERFLSIVFPPERGGLAYFVIESDYRIGKTGIIPTMESLAELILWVDGHIDVFPEETVLPGEL